MPKFEQGQKKIEGSGRASGTKNKNIELRGLIRDYTIEHFEEYTSCLSELEPKDYVKAFNDMMKFVIPTISAVKFEESTENKNASSLIGSLVNYNDD